MTAIEPERRVRPDLAEIYDAHAAPMYRHALMLLADHAAAEDAVQEVFVKLARQGSAAPPVESLPAYLRAAVRNTCYRMIESRRRRAALAKDAAPMLTAADPGCGDEPWRQEMEAALRRLPPEQREVIHLKVYEGLTFRRVAEVLGIPANTAASRYRYALDRLRRRLAPNPCPPRYPVPEPRP